MSKSKPYNTCPRCGSHLDHGEHCTCEDKQQGDAAEETAQSAGELATLDRRVPVLALGA